MNWFFIHSRNVVNIFLQSIGFFYENPEKNFTTRVHICFTSKVHFFCWLIEMHRISNNRYYILKSTFFRNSWTIRKNELSGKSTSYHCFCRRPIFFHTPDSIYTFNLLNYFLYFPNARFDKFNFYILNRNTKK